MREPGRGASNAATALPARDSGDVAGALANGAGVVLVASLVRELTETLNAGGIEEPAREARDIVAAVVDAPRFWASLNAEESLGAVDAARARGAAVKRAAGAPFAYAVGRAAFRHLTLVVDERVLIPRQETELLVQAVLDTVSEAGGIAVDVGTGSGAIALALAMEGRFESVIATDVSLGALRVARENADRNGASLRSTMEFRTGSLLAPVHDVRARVVVSNPPYIAHDEAAELPRSVRDWEPSVALFTGSGGMAATAAIVRDSAAILESGGVLALEVDSRRAALAAELVLADGHYTDVAVRLDLAGRERILIARRA